MDSNAQADFLRQYGAQLNEEQRKAVLAVDGPVLLLAVPGSGKTTVLVTRLGYMLRCRDIAPEHILTLTYTVAATADMRRRFQALFGETAAEGLEFRTINGICARIIQRYAGMIGRNAYELLTDEKKILRILTEVLAAQLPEYPTESEVKSARTLITYCKNMQLDEEGIRRLGERERLPLPAIFRAYDQWLKENHWMDYDDQMVYALRLLKRSPELLDYYRDRYRYICVDEAQDTSKIQHDIIRLLSGERGNLFMVGDEDQSIYGFRAAYPRALLDFERDHPGARVLVMDRNYRSNAQIVRAADGFIRRNRNRHEKRMVAVREAASEVRYVELKRRSNQYGYLCKVAADCDRETAVLYRDNESALPLIDRLEREEIPYRIKSMDMGFFTNRVVTDVTNILRFAQDPYDTELFLRIYFKCQTYLKKSQAEQLCRFSRQRELPVLSAAEELGGLNGMVLGKCRAMATNLRNMRNEPPGKALFRIEEPMGYGEYLERSGIDGNKLYILRQLAYAEPSIDRFLARLEELRALLQSKNQDVESRFLLSTIHSSKGLEYDRVFLLDVCDGVFPSRAAQAAQLGDIEEERRLFYVGVTRAKEELTVFCLSDQPSSFVRQMQEGPPKAGNGAASGARAAGAGKKQAPVQSRKQAKVAPGRSASQGTYQKPYGMGEGRWKKSGRVSGQ